MKPSLITLAAAIALATGLAAPACADEAAPPLLYTHSGSTMLPGGVP
ncbi:MAG: hypothetical protein JWN66_2672, partial [Sphingomonas bacterium]|nr:hypothetical protein [Sphingomonas bacterium]